VWVPIKIVTWIVTQPPRRKELVTQLVPAQPKAQSHTRAADGYGAAALMATSSDDRFDAWKPEAHESGLRHPSSLYVDIRVDVPQLAEGW
jgi:hypothetical protein